MNNTGAHAAAYRCQFCGGAAHPASGCEYSERAIVCGPCVRECWAWLRRHMERDRLRVGSEGAARKRFVRFYDHAAK